MDPPRKIHGGLPPAGSLPYLVTTVNPGKKLSITIGRLSAITQNIRFAIDLDQSLATLFTLRAETLSAVRPPARASQERLAATRVIRDAGEFLINRDSCLWVVARRGADEAGVSVPLGSAAPLG